MRWRFSDPNNFTPREQAPDTRNKQVREAADSVLVFGNFAVPFVGALPAILTTVSPEAA